MSRHLPAITRHAGEARYRARTLAHQLDELQRDLMSTATGQRADPERWIRALQEQLVILEGDLRRWREEQGVEGGG